MSALRASFLVANCITKAKKLLTTDEMCYVHLSRTFSKDCASRMVQFSLTTGQIDKVAEDNEP